MTESPPTESREAYAAWFLEGADYLTVLQFNGRNNRIRIVVQPPDMDEANRIAKFLCTRQRPTMVYAVRGIHDCHLHNISVT